MNRKEFINELKSEISGLPQEEIDAAVEYYEEYFDEAGPEREAEVIADLGSPKHAGAQIRSEYTVKSFDGDEKMTVRKSCSAIKYLIIGICSAPVSIPLAVVLFAVCLAAVAVAAAAALSLFAVFGAAFVTGIAAFVTGIMSFSVSASAAFMLIGAGLAAAGASAVFAVLTWMGVRALIKASARAAGRINEKRRMRRPAKDNAAASEKKEGGGVSDE